MEPKYIAALIGALIVVLCAILAWRALLRAFRRWAFGDEKAHIAHAWHDVEGLMARNDAMSARLAVMHADAVLDQALRMKHFPGDRFATRLQFAQRKYRSLRRVWWAHTLRNELSHNPHAVLRMPEARKAVAAFQQALRELGAL